MMNGFGVYTTWVTIAFILNVDISLIYAVGFGETVSIYVDQLWYKINRISTDK